MGENISAISSDNKSQQAAHADKCQGKSFDHEKIAPAEISHFTRLTGEALALCYRGANGYEAILRAREALVLSGEPYADFNYAVIDLSPYVEDVLREFLAVARSRGAPLIVMITPAAAERLKPLAESLGLQNGGGFPLMIRDGSLLPPALSSYECRRVTNEEELLLANQILAKASGIPVKAVNAAYGKRLLDAAGLEMFLAYREGQAVSAVQTSRAGSDIGIWAMVTPPKLQRQGAGAALLSYIINHHVNQGATRFFLGSTEAGRRLYQSKGFIKIGEWSVWLDGESSQTHT